MIARCGALMAFDMAADREKLGSLRKEYKKYEEDCRAEGKWPDGPQVWSMKRGGT